jgi:hypothetical protein
MWGLALSTSIKFTVGIILVSGLVSFVKNFILQLIGSNLGGWLIILFDQFLTLPGVLIHELAHALGAILTGAKVVHFTIIKHGDALGSVQVAFTDHFLLGSIQRYVVAIAPIVVGGILTFLICKRMAGHHNIWSIYFLICIIAHMDLSSQDIRVLLPGLPVIVFIGTVIARLALRSK